MWFGVIVVFAYLITMAAYIGAPKPSDQRYTPGAKLQFITSLILEILKFSLFLIYFKSSL